MPLLLVSLAAQAPGRAEQFWPEWRGPLATGASPTATPPLEWSDTKNVKWKVEIPGRGSASPVVWGDRLFLLTAVPVGVAPDASHAPRGAQPVPHKFVILAIDRHTGKTLWERVAREEAPHEASHPENGTWASSSAVTDGEHVIASFESEGIYAFDMNGAPVWQKDLGDKRMRNQFGEGSTPALHGNHLVVVWDHQGESFIIALDKRTGQELWRQKRDEIDSWATPLIVESGGRAQVVTAGMNRVRSYDLETGELVWHAPGLTMNPIPSPVAGDGFVYLTSGFRGNSLKAIRLAGASGDLTGTDAIAWTLNRDTPYVPSPLLVRRHPLPAQDEHRDPVGVRREVGLAAFPAPAAGARSGGVRFPGRRGGPRVHHRARRRDGGHQERAGIRSARREPPVGRLRRVAGPGRRRHLYAGL